MRFYSPAKINVHLDIGALREDGYELFARIIRANMRHAGALRIDHALGLFRMFCIPSGRPAQEGAYIDYPSEDLLRIIALESVRARTVVIAEDLGTVTGEAREALHRYGMLSYRLLYFERDWDSGAFLPPEAYPEQALAAVNTHDLPTLKGFTRGRDISQRVRLGITSVDKEEEAMAERKDEVRRLQEALGVEDVEADIFQAAHAFLARSPALLVSVSLDDIMGDLEQQNVPGTTAGTTNGHPNWQRKSAKTFENLKASGTMLKTLLSILATQGR